MIVRDLIAAAVWVVCKLGGLLLVGSIIVFILNVIAIGNVAAHVFVFLFGMFIFCLFILWVVSMITSLPILFWRRRAKHTFRVLAHSSRHRFAIQIRLFYIWFFISKNSDQEITLHFWDDSFYSLHDIWYITHEEEAEVQTWRLLSQTINPNGNKYTTRKVIVYNN